MQASGRVRGDDLQSPDGETAGTLLDGRVSYIQPRHGYRTGLEPVLLAASVPASSGEAVVEAGTGAGAGLLALAARVPGVVGLGIEVDPAQADFARRNFAGNGLASCRVEECDLGDWRPEGRFDHAFANPPWHSEQGTGSPVPGRRSAKIASPALLGLWTKALAAGLRRRGTLSLILPSASLASGVSALVDANCAEMTLIPLWRRQGEQARLMILRGVMEGKGGCRLHAGLLLHQTDGSLTDAAEAILRRGAALI